MFLIIIIKKESHLLTGFPFVGKGEFVWTRQYHFYSTFLRRTLVRQQEISNAHRELSTKWPGIPDILSDITTNGTISSVCSNISTSKVLSN